MPKSFEIRARHLSTEELTERSMKGASSSISKAVPRKLFGMIDKNERCTTDAIVITECETALEADNSLYILEDDLVCNVEDAGLGLDITGTGITLDCNGKALTGFVPADFRFSFFDGIRIRNDNIVIRNCEITGFDDGIKVGQDNAKVSNILLQNIDSHHNRFDGLEVESFRGVFSDITVFDSKFNDNRENGFKVNREIRRVANLVMSGVEANRNGHSGFVLGGFIETGRLVGVEANNNGSADVAETPGKRTGITIEGVEGMEDGDTNFVIQDSRACGNGDESNDLDIRDPFNAATFQAMSCTNDDGKGICACDCS